MQKQKRNDNKMVRTTVSLPYWLHKRLKLQAVDVGMSFSDVVVEEIEKAKVLEKLEDGENDYLKKLSKLDLSWFDKEAEEDYKKVRKELDERLKRYDW